MVISGWVTGSAVESGRVGRSRKANAIIRIVLCVLLGIANC